MKQKTINAFREARLWIGGVIIPAMGVGVVCYNNPDVRYWFHDKKQKLKDKFSSKK